MENEAHPGREEDLVALLHRGMDAVVFALTQRDLGPLSEMVTPDVIWEPLRSQVEGAYVGLEGLARFASDHLESFTTFEPDFEDVRDLGDGRVLAIGTLTVRGRESGIETVTSSAGIATYRDGLVAHWKDYGDRDVALRAAGLA